jgi:hypothetical protein
MVTQPCGTTIWDYHLGQWANPLGSPGWRARVWATEAAEGTQGNSRELKGTHQKVRGNSWELTKYKVPKGPRIRVKTRGKLTKGSRGNSGNSPFGVHLGCRLGMGGRARRVAKRVRENYSQSVKSRNHYVSCDFLRFPFANLLKT